MKKLAIAVLLVVAGCRGSSGGIGPVSAGGAPSPREAIERFVAAAKSQDYDGMSLIFGSTAGPARATIAKEDLEKREFIMMRCLRHDRVLVGADIATPTGERVSAVQFWFKDLTATTDFAAVQGPNGRWYVMSYQTDPMRQICAAV